MLSNLRQIGLAMMQYTQDNEEQFPSSGQRDGLATPTSSYSRT